MAPSTRTMTTASAPEKRMFEGQASVAHLPVPKLEDTLPKYLRTTLPLQTSQSLAVTESAVKSALSGKDAAFVRELQQRLEHRANNEGRDSWLAEWWLSYAYMSYRGELVPNVSYFYLHRSDPKAKTNVARAAQMMKATMIFRELVNTEQLAPEKTKTGYLDMAPFKYLFNVCRIPQAGEDVCFTADPAKHNHVIVARNGYFYEFDLIHPISGNQLSVPEIEVQLSKILSDKRSASMNKQPIGAFTADDRDTWTEARKALLSGPHAEKNRKSLERIESGVVLFALDNGKPVSLEDRGWNVWRGNQGKNRFYDKQQFVVSENGVSGFVGEHSMLDGTHTMRLNNFVLTALADGKIPLEGEGAGAVLDDPVLLEFGEDAATEKAANDSAARFALSMEKEALSVLDFEGYGKGFVKQCKTSPDAWAQMAIQMAYYKMFGTSGATYEAAQTRKFKGGRTETIRSCSVESQAFVEAMGNVNTPDADRVKLFERACNQHVTYARECAEGHGVDRHLLGLKLSMRPGEELPALFKDPMNATSGTWLLSTSQISAELFDAWGFGQVTPKGFGVAYAIKENAFTFTIVCLKDEHDPKEFTHYLNEALVELKQLYMRVHKSKM